MKLRSYCFVLAVLGACKSAGPAPSPELGPGQPTPDTSPKTQVPPSFPCGDLTITFGEQMPGDVSIGNQTTADCYAWQEFIALNWPAAGDQFGAPGDQSAVRWQGYMNVHQLFQPGGKPPPPWGTPPKITSECLSEANLTEAQARTVHPLVNATKFSSESFDWGDSAQAFPRNAPAWLGDTNGNNVWYEIRVNKDEYDFVVENQFYDARKQLAFYTDQNPVTVPLQLPAGTASETGAVELKAAWMEVPDPGDPKWNAYKLSAAVVPDPATNKCETVTVALVGFHIIHKTESQPTWIWATFEHANNAPDDSAQGAPPANGQSWNFYSAQCAAQTIDVESPCPSKPAKVTTTCDANASPPYPIGNDCPAPTPTQVTRINPIDLTATKVNRTVHAAIQNAFSDSVWQNYLLVNVVWSALPPSIPPTDCQAGSQGCQRTTAPQLTQSLNPSGAVANTVLETYVQDHFPDNPFAKSNCIICHQGATVAGATKQAPYAADFSFVLREAQSSVAAPDASSPRRKAPASRPGEPRPIRQIFQ